MNRMLPCLALLGVFLLGTREVRAGIVYDFEDIPLGTSTPFSDTKGGVVASFAAETGADPGGFTVGPSFFAAPMLGNVLLDPGPSGASSISLIVGFSQALTSVTLDFATDGDSQFNLVTAVG